MENGSISRLSQTSSPTCVSPNETGTGQQSLVNNLASVRISPNKLSHKEAMPKNSHFSDSDHSTASSRSKDYYIFDNININSKMKETASYHVFTKKRLQDLKEYISKFSFLDPECTKFIYCYKWDFVNFLLDFPLECEQESNVPFDPAAKKILQILEQFPFDEISHDEECECEEKRKNKLVENVKSEPNDYELFYPVIELGLKANDGFVENKNILVSKLEDDIWICIKNEVRFMQQKH